MTEALVVNTPVTEDRVALMIQKAVTTALDEHEKQLKAHMDKQFAQLQSSFDSAFPNGDPHGHRLAHETEIRSASEWDRIKTEALNKVITGGVWALVVFLALAIWDRFKHEVLR